MNIREEQHIMTPARLEAALLGFVRKQPFRPFLIEMAEDQRVLVEDPEKLAVGAGGGASYFHKGEIYLIDCERVLKVKAIAPSEKR